MSSLLTLEKLLETEAVTEQILRYLPVQDLLQLSLVSKSLLAKSRRVLRDFKKCTVLFTGRSCCAELKEFSTILRSMSDIPFNGFHINPAHLNGPCVTQDKAEIQGIINAILESIPRVRFLRVHWSRLLGLEDHNCPILVSFMEELFTPERAPGLEVLDISDLPELVPFSQCFKIQELKRSLPGLKLVKMIHPRIQVLDFVREINVAAPEVKELLVSVHPAQLDAFFSMGKTRAISKIFLNPVKSEGKICFRFSKTKPKLKYLSFSSISDRNYCPSSYFFNTLTWVMESSQNSLRYLYADQLDLIWLSSTSKIRFPNLTHLSTRYGMELDEKLGFPSLKHVDFEFLFPRLTSVQINTEHLRPDFEISEEVLTSVREAARNEGKKALGLSKSVRTLRIQYGWSLVREGKLEVVAEVFPNVKEIVFEERETFFVDCLEEIHHCWPELEELTVDGYKIWKHVRDFQTFQSDAKFIGVSEEKAKELMGLGEKELETAVLEPTRFSFLKFKCLKRFRINTNHQTEPCTVPHSDFIFSSLTARLVFARMPQLKVEIGRNLCNPAKGVKNCGYELNELKPFVTFRQHSAEAINQEHLPDIY